MIRSHFINILLLITGYFIYITYKPFLMDILIAILLAISLSKIFVFINKKFKNIYISSSILTLALTFLLFSPLFYFILEAADTIKKIDPNMINLIVNKIKELLNYLPETISQKIEVYISTANLNLIYKNIVSIIAPLTAKSAIFFKDMILIVIFFFFILIYSNKIVKFLQDILPLSKKQFYSLFKDTEEVTGLVFYSTIVTAIFEGLLFGVFLQFYGFDGLFFTIMYAFASLIPVIGGIIMWLPISLYLYTLGDIKGALIVAIYSIIVISIIADTFIKPMIIDIIKTHMKNSLELSPILIFFSIIAGLSSFGFWGIIIGPAITSVFISLLNFYKKF